jgi:hypothetical protein
MLFISLDRLEKKPDKNDVEMIEDKVYMYVCMYVYMYIYIYVHICIYICTYL